MRMSAVGKIDEAHLLDHEQLESVRMLTNHDMDATSPLACLLVGQPTLRRKIKLGILAALDQRIALRYSMRSEEHTSELQSRQYLVCRLLLEKKKQNKTKKV